jgi:Cu(I)/Ag(I) efflux system membrane fusion protein
MLGSSYVVESGLTEGEEVVTQGTFNVDAAAQLEGIPSMMNPSGGAISSMPGMVMPGDAKPRDRKSTPGMIRPSDDKPKDNKSMPGMDMPGKSNPKDKK